MQMLIFEKSVARLPEPLATVNTTGIINAFRAENGLTISHRAESIQSLPAENQGLPDHTSAVGLHR
jgi:hypothetical protein